MPFIPLKMAVPGKLMMAGEYAVLSPHQKAIVTAVNRYVKITVYESREHELDLPDLGLHKITWRWEMGKVHFSNEDQRLSFIKQAIWVVHQYLEDSNGLSRPFGLLIESELNHASGRKLGLGSSAAIVTGIVASLLHVSNGGSMGLEKKTIFKLSAIAHFLKQGSGSGADIAASTYGGLIGYTSFNPEWLREQLKGDVNLRKLVTQSWPYFSLKRLKLPDGLSFCVGWTGKPASTSSMIRQVNQLKEQEPETYRRFLTESGQAVETVLKGFQEVREETILKGLSENRRALVQLGQWAQAPIETEKLAELSDLAVECGGAGKSSGAGAGDCGIALIRTQDKDKLLNRWRDAGIELLPVVPAENGVCILNRSERCAGAQ